MAPHKGKKKVSRKAPPLPSKFAVKELDPKQIISERTLVEQLYRVEETAGEKHTIHLVFLDRHGWYCEHHGIECVAVERAQKFAKRR